MAVYLEFMPSRMLPLLAVAALAACATAGSAPSPAPAPSASMARGPVADSLAAAGRLPPIDSVIGPLDLRVRYPAEGAVVEAGDSTFLFGTTGTGDASLTIDGATVRVAPNGAWLAWVGLPPDTLMRLQLRAATPTDSEAVTLTLRRPARFAPPMAGLWLDSTSITPRGDIVWPGNEYLNLGIRAAPGAEVRLRLGDSLLATFTPDSRPDDLPWGIRAFDRDTQNLARTRASDRYVALVRGRSLPDSGAVIEAVRGMDTVRTPWRARVALLDTIPRTLELDDGGSPGADGITIGRAWPGATYHWFWPAGTRVRDAGRVNADQRVELAPGVYAWVPAADARPVPEPAGPSVVGSLTLTPLADRATLRIPLSTPVAYEITENDRTLVITLYGAVGDVNWIRYGADDPLVAAMAWTQAADGVRLTVELSEPVWGFRSRWDRGDLLVEIRRPPPIRRAHPFAGLVIAVDPGHPPGGASGGTGLTEAEANLGVSLLLRDLLEEAGATVVMTRTGDSAVGLAERPRLAEAAGAHILISVHNNALPDGVNPFPNNGTSVFYNHPRSIPLARAVQRELVRQLGLRDLGVGRGDLALVRPTWMPAILTEGLFLMVPEQEAALRSPEGRRRYAEGIFNGTRAFLRERAAAE